MSIRTMFDIATRAQVFGIEGYEVPRYYCDPIKQVKNILFSKFELFVIKKIGQRQRIRRT